MILESLALDLKLRGLKPKTIAEYVRIAQPAVELPKTRSSIAAWIYAADTASKRRHRYLAVNALGRMLVEDGELHANPCARIPMPQEVATPQPILGDRALAALLRSCEQTWLGRWDRALLSVLASTGCRAAELVAIHRADVNVSAGQVIVRNGKGGKWRVAYLDDSAKRSLLVYLRSHRGATHLWTTAGSFHSTPFI